VQFPREFAHLFVELRFVIRFLNSVSFLTSKSLIFVVRCPQALHRLERSDLNVRSCPAGRRDEAGARKAAAEIVAFLRDGVMPERVA
jgi:hypothetical protein